MPNPWDVGSAKVLTTLGFCALATTSAGFAGSLGRQRPADRARGVDRPRDRADRPRSTCRSTSTSEDCFADDRRPAWSRPSRLLDATDAAGFSIEDYDPRAGEIRPVEVAIERVAAARSASADLVLTARAENLLHGIADLDDTIARLVAYRDAGADVLYAPGLMQARRHRPGRRRGRRADQRAGAAGHAAGAGAGGRSASLGSRSAACSPGPPTACWPTRPTELMGPGTHGATSKHMLSGELRTSAFGDDRPR